MVEGDGPRFDSHEPRSRVEEHAGGCRYTNHTEATIPNSDDIKAVLSQYLTRLWRYALVLSGRRDVADDLVQATCVIALESTDQVIAGKRLHSWLFLILHSVWLNDIRSRRIPTGYGSIDVGEALLVDGGGETGTRVLVAQVLKEALALPERQRTAVFLSYVEGLSYREAAEVLGVPIGTVLSRLATARMRLADALGPIESQQLSSEDGRQVETPDH